MKKCAKFWQLTLGSGLWLSVAVSSVQAQVSDTQVGALVEALRQAAPQTGKQNDGLYSDWQVQPQNIPRWSKSCIGRELTPEQFEGNPATARSVISCVARDVLRDEYRASGNNESVAIRRVAAWWMTGDPNRYNTGETAAYTQRVLNFYQSNKSGRPSTTSSQQNSQAPAQQDSNLPSEQTTAYNRYMRVGYEASQRKDYATALLYFKRALDERPEDSYALKAIRNIESYQKTPQSARPTASSTASGTTGSAINQQQAIALINRWLQSKAEIFAPPFNQERLNKLATGELYASLVRPRGVIDWLKRNQAYYRYGVQKVEAVQQFATSRDRATIEVKLTEDRTLYRNGKVDPRQTDFSVQQVRYSLERVDGQWKIADYKTVNGSLLERAILTTTTSNQEVSR